MLAKTILAFAGLMASASAILVTSPTKDQTIDLSKSFDITWTSVSSDPSTFELVLVDQSKINNPIVIANSVKSSDNKYTVTKLAATPGANYKFNFLSVDPLNTGILAQSQTFNVTAPASSSSSSSSTTSTITSTGTLTSTTTDASTTETSTSASITTSTKTSASNGTAAATASSTAPTATKNSAVTLDRTVGVAGGVLAGLYMLLA